MGIVLPGQFDTWSGQYWTNMSNTSMPAADMPVGPICLQQICQYHYKFILKKQVLQCREHMVKLLKTNFKCNCRVGASPRFAAS